jgi:cysteine synthase
LDINLYFYFLLKLTENMKIASNIIQLIGRTPLVRLNRLGSETGVTLLAKMESMNPGGSVKDRLAVAMIEAAEKEGAINNQTRIIEPTSGNTGIGLAMICAAKGYHLTIVMPESVSVERRMIIKAYGADLVLTPAAGGMSEAIATSRNLASTNANSFIPMQFSNPANPEIHRRTTALEIWNDTGGKIDFFVAGAGTGGTITGVSEILKQKNPALKSIVVEPLSSPVLSEGKSGKHMIQGIGPGFIPEVLNTKIYDEIFRVSDDDAFETARKLAKMEGILAGMSSGANCHAAMEIAARAGNKGKTIVFIVCDTGERYISTPLFNLPQND